MTSESDLIVIGGGIVGLATAYRFLERFPGKTVTVLEKEAEIARHQTGRNSGVLHTGIYYRPGSLKALNCRAGKQAMQEFCTRENIPFDLCGKIIVGWKSTSFRGWRRCWSAGRRMALCATGSRRSRFARLSRIAWAWRAFMCPRRASS